MLFRSIARGIIRTGAKKLLKQAINSATTSGSNTDIKTNQWRLIHNWNKTSVFTINYREKYSRKNTFCLENKSYNDASITKTFQVKPNTTYRFSAMVKYKDFVAKPGDNVSGASIGEAGTYENSSYCTLDEWTRLEYLFDSGDKTSIPLCLRNGMFQGICKGTAYFTDVKLEENRAKKTNEWNVLAVIFKNVDTDAIVKGEKIHFSAGLDDRDVNQLTEALYHLLYSFDSISGGLMKVGNIDVVTPEAPITSLNESNNSVNPYHASVSSSLDYYLSKGTYNQIIVISPIRKISPGWGGLGGGKYKGIHFCQTNYTSRDVHPGHFKAFPDAIFVHEMLHCMEFESRKINPEKTAKLHGNQEYGFVDGSDEWRSWYTAYMRCLLKDNKGLDPSVYMVNATADYHLVSDDMSFSLS